MKLLVCLYGSFANLFQLHQPNISGSSSQYINTKPGSFAFLILHPHTHPRTYKQHLSYHRSAISMNDKHKNIQNNTFNPNIFIILTLFHILRLINQVPLYNLKRPFHIFMNLIYNLRNHLFFCYEKLDSKKQKILAKRHENFSEIIPRTGTGSKEEEERSDPRRVSTLEVRRRTKITHRAWDAETN